MAKSRKRKTDYQAAYRYVAYMDTHKPEEMARVRKFGTPSDELIEFSSDSFPESLNTVKGQRLLYSVLQRFDIFVKTIPMKSYNLLQWSKQYLHHHRSDTLRNLHMVAEAVLFRAATEFKQQVIFAFDSIITWINRVYGRTLGYKTIRRCLEMLEDQGIIVVDEWGVKGIRDRATLITVCFLSEKLEEKYPVAVDDWVLEHSYAMEAVYKREKQVIKDIADAKYRKHLQLLAEETVIAQQESAQINTHMYPRVAGEPGSRVSWTPIEQNDVIVVPGQEKEVSRAQTTRLLGELVPAVQEDESDRGKVSVGVSHRTDQNQCGSTGESPPRATSWDSYYAFLDVDDRDEAEFEDWCAERGIPAYVD